MGKLIPITWYSKEERKLAVPIPRRLVTIKPPVRTVERMFPRRFTAKTYIYGGGGIITLPDGRKLPRVGVSGRIDEFFIPIDLKLIAVRKDDKWVEIPERPILMPVSWTARRWRAEIPAEIRRKYEIMPREYVMLEYTTYVTNWEDVRDIKKWKKTIEKKKIPVLRIYHDGVIYEVDEFDEKTNRWIWIIPNNVAEDEGLYIAMDIGAIPDAEVYFNEMENQVELDFIIEAFRDKEVSARLGIARRNMVVRNYTLKQEAIEEGGKTPEDFLIEVRATFITTPVREFYQGKGKHMKLVAGPYEDINGALNITCYNILRYFFMQVAERKGHFYNPILSHKFYEKVEETIGIEKNKVIDYGEAKDERFGYVIKYIRIVNASAKRRGRAWIYLTDEIDRKIKQMGGIVDSRGFVWRRE